MANPLITPNMGLLEPATGNTLSPTWAQDLNQDMSILDQHDHSAGSGVAITPSGLNINADLPFGDNNAVGLRSSRYTVQLSPLSLGSDIGCTYVSGVDLYYNDINGNQIRLTASGAIAGTPGSIAGLVSPASASYNPSNQTFTWQSASNVAANMDAATYILRYPGSYPTPSGNYIALAAPSALSSGFQITFPSALPSAQSFLTLDGTGGLATPIDFVGGIQDTNIANAAITSQKLASNINVSGQLTQNLQNAVVSLYNDTNAQGIVRGVINSDGSVASGTGFTVSNPSTGHYTITLINLFSDTPAVATSLTVGVGVVDAQGSTSSISIRTKNLSGTDTNLAFQFIAIGQRV